MSTILIVEDSKTQELLLKTSLEKAGYEVICADAGLVALDIMRKHKPDVVITDIRMPDMNGYELSWKIKNDFTLKHIPVILLSELSETKDIITGLKSLADTYVIKPFDENELFRTIEFLLENPSAIAERKPLTVVIDGFKHPIHSNRRQILSFLLSTYDTVINRNDKLVQVQTRLRLANDDLVNKSQQLEESEKCFRSLVETVPDIIYRIDEDGKILFFNGSIRKLGYEPEDLVGQHFSCLLADHQIENISRQKVLALISSDKDKMAVQPKLFDERRSGERRTSGLEILLKMKNSTTIVSGKTEALADGFIDVEVNSTGMYQLNNSEEIFVGTVGIIRDITDRKIAEKRLQKAKQEADKSNLAKSVFLSKMSHELRTPLNAIMGFSQLLTSDIERPLNDDQQESAEQIFQAGQHLLGLINEVLDLSSIEAGKLQLNLVNSPVNDFIDECVSMSKVLADSNKISFDFHDRINNSTVHVAIDFQRIKQVILNLLSNAIKYNKQHGHVDLITEIINDDYVCISIIDTGIGMDEDFLKQVFQPFTREKQVQKMEGTGIGLAITKQLIELMNGHIDVESEKDKGSTFRIQLPLVNS